MRTLKKPEKVRAENIRLQAVRAREEMVRTLQTEPDLIPVVFPPVCSDDHLREVIKALDQLRRIKKTLVYGFLGVTVSSVMMPDSIVDGVGQLIHFSNSFIRFASICFAVPMGMGVMFVDRCADPKNMLLKNTANLPAKNLAIEKLRLERNARIYEKQKLVKQRIAKQVLMNCAKMETTIAARAKKFGQNHGVCYAVPARRKALRKTLHARYSAGHII